MAHLKLVYNPKSYQSPVVVDYDRVVNVDEKGEEHIVYVPSDYPRRQQALGNFKQWSLQSLIDAGIDPRFGIQTGFNTGLDAEREISRGAAVVTSIVESDKK